MLRRTIRPAQKHSAIKVHGIWAMIRVLLADDHPLILHGVRELLERRNDMVVVGQEKDSDSAASAVARLKPDVLIQDLEMKGRMSGIEVIRHVTKNFPATRVVVLSMHSTVASAWEAMEQGARGPTMSFRAPPLVPRWAPRGSWVV